MVSVSYLFPFVMFYKTKIIKNEILYKMHLLSKCFIHTILTFYMQLYTLMSFLLQIKRFLSKTSSHLRIFINVCISFLFYFWQDFYFFGNKGKKYNFMCVKFIFVLSLIICEKRIKNIYFFKYFCFLLQTFCWCCI